MTSLRLQSTLIHDLRLFGFFIVLFRFTKALDSIKSLRKDRVAELKAEKERLEGLSREKAHADKLHDRISSLTSDIANKEIGYDAMREEYDLLVIANQKFYDSATKFREIFMQVENLQEKKKHYQQELDDARENLQEMSGKNFVARTPFKPELGFALRS